MIELKSLSDEERLNISLQCEPFFLVSKPTKRFAHLHDYFVHEVGKKYSKEIWLLLTCFIKSVKYGNNGTRFSLNKANFVKANKIHKQKLSLARTKDFIEYLDRRGYITFYKGFKVSDSFSMTTCLMMTEKLKSLIDKDVAKKFGCKREPLCFLEVKSQDNKTLLSTTDFRGYSSIVKFMEKYNNLLADSEIMKPNQDTGELLKCSVVYKRVFSGGLCGAGRFYSMGKIQTLESDLRPHIIVNGRNITEVDFCNLHPRILYTEEGVLLQEDWDAYEINTLFWITEDHKKRRAFIKSAYLSVLFSENEEQAVKSVLHSANKDANIKIHNKRDAAVVVREILNKNSPIKHHFFTDRLWARLQNIDSELASIIIGSFTERGVVCLGWHDSFCVQDNLREDLISIMESAWVKVLGTDMNFKYDVKF